MTDNNGQQETPAPTPEPSAALPEELHELRRFWREYGWSLGAAAAVALLAVAGVGIYRGRAAAARSQAAMALNTARSVQDLENLVTRYASSPAAPVALLKLARAYYDGGNYDAAAAKYDEFKRRFAQHPLAAAADLGAVHCQEAQGRLTEALAGFQSFLAAQPTHFLAPQAAFGAARCLEALGRLTEAKTVYEDFLAAHPDSGWTSRAEEAVELLNRRLAAPSRGDAAPAETLAPVTNLTVLPPSAPPAP